MYCIILDFCRTCFLFLSLTFCLFLCIEIPVNPILIFAKLSQTENNEHVQRQHNAEGNLDLYPLSLDARVSHPAGHFSKVLRVNLPLVQLVGIVDSNPNCPSKLK